MLPLFCFASFFVVMLLLKSRPFFQSSSLICRRSDSRACFFLFFLLLIWRYSFFRVFFIPLPFSLCMESTPYVLSFWVVFFYIVTTGWIFDISFTRKFSGKISPPKISSGNFGSNSPSRGNFEAQNFLETRGNFTRKFYEEILGSLDNRTEISTLSQYWMMPTTYTQLCSLMYSHMHRVTQTLPQEP